MMNKFTLIHDDGKARTEMSFDEIGLQEVLEHVDRFIKAAGFIPKGELVYLEEDTEELSLSGLEEQCKKILCKKILSEFYDD